MLWMVAMIALLRICDRPCLIHLVQQQALLRPNDLLARGIVEVGHLLELERVSVETLARLGGGNDLGRDLVAELAARRGDGMAVAQSGEKRE